MGLLACGGACSSGLEDTREDESALGKDAGSHGNTDGGTAQDGGKAPDTGKDASPADAAACKASVTRMVAANLSSGPKQSYDPGHGTRILTGLRPTVTMLQEFNVGENTPSDLAQWVETTHGKGCSYVRGEGSIPNGIVSCLPVVASGHWKDESVNDRDFVWARIDVPGKVDLFIVSVHLLTHKGRHKQGVALEKLISANAEDAWVVVGGDMNTTSRKDEAIVSLRPHVDTFAPYPVGPASSSESENTNSGRKEPLDWLLVSPSLKAFAVDVQLGQGPAYPNGLVFDSRYYKPLSDVPGVQQGDSAADQMQHMAVIKDFRICE
ncbi:MAG: endonuclease/exonuclease/phosphatase family protein [Polyangiaceae bacterium]|nr:endonuclease/exonuclease/phosphatase family protein [Polyangiaceae bacterium]